MFSVELTLLSFSCTRLGEEALLGLDNLPLSLVCKLLSCLLWQSDNNLALPLPPIPH